MKRILWGIALCISVIIIVAGAGICQRKYDPYWQAAKIIGNVQTALQEDDKAGKLTSLSRVIPFCYQSADGTIVNYYCCITTYLDGDKRIGLNKAALLQVVDVDALEDLRNCEVNGLDAVMGVLKDKTYLCWTLSPKYSCVIEYPTGSVAQEDIFHMAESVEAPEW